MKSRLLTLALVSALLSCIPFDSHTVEGRAPAWLNVMQDQKQRHCGGTKYCYAMDNVWVIPDTGDFVLIQAGSTLWKIPANRIIESWDNHTYVCLEADVVDEENNNEEVECPPLIQPDNKKIIDEWYGCIKCILLKQSAPEG